MGRLMKLSREAQVVLGGSVLYLIFSFLDWQQVKFCSTGFGCVEAGRSEWHGVGVIAGLLVISLLLWEAARLLGLELEFGSLTQGVISVGLALLLVLFTVITFLSHDEFRHWPEWAGLVLAVVIAFAAIARGRTEGVELPKLPSTAGGMGSSNGGSSAGAGGSGSMTTPPAPDAPSEGSGGDPEPAG